MINFRIPYFPILFFLCILIAACGNEPQIEDITLPEWNSEDRIYRLQAGETGIFAANENDLFFYPYSGETGWTALGLSRYVDENASVRDFILFEDNRLIASRAGDIPMWRTTDFGENWQPLGNNLDFEIVSSLASASDSGNLYAMSSGILGFSNDGGNSWLQINRTGSNAGILLVDPNNTEHVWVGGFGVTFNVFLDRSFDGGETWEKLHPLNLNYPVLRAFLLHPAIAGNMLMGIDAPVGIIRSEDFGESWEKILENKPVRALANGKSETDRVYAAGWGHESLKMSLLISDDFGDNWDILVYESGPDSVTVNDLAVTELNGLETIFLATDRHGVFRYSEGVFTSVD